VYDEWKKWKKRIKKPAKPRLNSHLMRMDRNKDDNADRKELGVNQCSTNTKSYRGTDNCGSRQDRGRRNSPSGTEDRGKKRKKRRQEKKGTSSDNTGDESGGGRDGGISDYKEETIHQGGGTQGVKRTYSYHYTSSDAGGLAK